VELHAHSSICILRYVQKQTVHNELRSDPVYYLMALTGVSKSDYTDTQPAALNFFWEFCFIVLRDWTG